MLSRMLWLSAWFPALLAVPLAAQPARPTPADRQLIVAGLWAAARYNYAYWDAVRANWDSAFAATVTFTGERPAPNDHKFYYEASRWERAVARMLDGERFTALHLLLKLPGGAERGASVTRSVPLTSHWPIEHEPLEADTLPDGVIWVRVNTFSDPDVLEQFDRAIGDATREGPRHRGLILDLRETEWSAEGRDRSYELLSRLIERPFLTARRKMVLYRPDTTGVWLSVPSDTIWPPSKRERVAYSGPVALLISPRTSGPAEDLLVSFQAGGRGPTFGETSAGNTGETVTLALASGWKLRVTVARDAFPAPDGKEFVRTGIPPQYPVEVRVEDVLAGRDAVLDRARAYLTETARR